MKILAIETSCDETAAAVVEDGRRILSSVVASQINDHIKFGGVVPEIASRRHIEVISQVVEKALKDARINEKDLSAVAVTFAPGLVGALLVGVNYAKGFAYSSGLPVVPVHHLRSHIAANYLCHPKLEPPFLSLIVSGGHSHIVKVSSYTDFSVLGKTRDDAAGEVLDKVARAMGFPYPGGANMDKLCNKGNPKAYALPHPKVDNAPLDFSFSGLKTAAINIIHNAKQKEQKISKCDLGASLMETVADCLIEKVAIAANLENTTKIVLAGGVAANSFLRRKLINFCNQQKFDLFVPSIDLCGDNAAMVGSQGYYELLGKNITDLNLNAYATLSIDKLKI